MQRGGLGTGRKLTAWYKKFKVFIVSSWATYFGLSLTFNIVFILFESERHTNLFKFCFS